MRLLPLALAACVAGCASAQRDALRPEGPREPARPAALVAPAQETIVAPPAQSADGDNSFASGVPTGDATAEPPRRRGFGLTGLFGADRGAADRGPGPDRSRGTAPHRPGAEVATRADQRAGPSTVVVRPRRASGLPGVVPRHNVPQTGSLRGAMASAYDNNPTINRQRASLRAADEDVAIARSGNRPTVEFGVSAGYESVRTVNAPGVGTITDDRTPAILTLDVTQPLFRGFQTRNDTRRAAADVRAEREQLSAVQQDVLLQVAFAALDVERFRGGAALRQREAAFLVEQLSAARARLEFGEGTRTDIDQARARQAETEALVVDERAAAEAAEARFRQLTGLEPGAIRLDVDVARLIPRTLADALRLAQDNNPDIHAALHAVDAANFQVKSIEGETLPTVALTGRVQAGIGTSEADRTESAEVRLNVTVPIYQGGAVSARVRQAKEALGAARIDVDIARDETRSDVASAWASYTAARDAVRSAEVSIAAARSAVEGLLAELQVGQRTTVDVLDAQRDLIRAQITRLAAIRQREGAAFTLLRETGALTVHILGLDVVPYVPQEHYAAVKDRWKGLRTPDGR